MGFGLYGKHPAFGDFIAQGLSDDLRHGIEGWSESVMAALSRAWGEAWKSRFDACPVLGLWLGAGVGGNVGFLGAIFPSQDKVGRRFPLVIGWEGTLQPPTLAPAAAGAVLPVLRGALQTVPAREGDARGFAADLGAAAGAPPPAAPEPAYWAARRDGDMSRLFEDARPEEQSRSGAGRSCLWSDSPLACLFAAAGWPSSDVFLWILSGAALSAPAEGEVVA